MCGPQIAAGGSDSLELISASAASTVWFYSLLMKLQQNLLSPRGKPGSGLSPRGKPGSGLSPSGLTGYFLTF